MNAAVPTFEVFVDRYQRAADAMGEPLDLYRAACPFWAASVAAERGLAATVAAAIGSATLVAPGPSTIGGVAPAQADYANLIGREVARVNGQRFGLDPDDGALLWDAAESPDFLELCADLLDPMPGAISPSLVNSASPPVLPKIYLASALTGFRDACIEWLEEHGIDGPAALERSERGSAALGRQREINAQVVSMLRRLGLEVFAPQEQYDPDLHSDEKPIAVHDGDYRAVITSDGLVWIGDFPATGGGKEIAWAEGNGAQILALSTPGARTSRLISGTPHSYTEDVVATEELAQRALSWALDVLPQLARHADARNQGRGVLDLVSALESRRQRFPASARTRRVDEIVGSPDGLFNATIGELTSLARDLGLSVKVTIAPSVPRPVGETDPGRLANWLLQRHGLPVPPIDPRLLAESMGIVAIRPGARDDAVGTTVRRADGSYELFLRPHQPPQRRRFTIAHEVAHLVASPDERITVHREGPNADADLERLCDSVAAALLMPDYWLKPRVEALLLDGTSRLDTLRAVALEAQVALSTAAIRLADVRNDMWILCEIERNEGGGWKVVQLWGDRRLRTGSVTFSDQSNIVLDHLVSSTTTGVSLRMNVSGTWHTVTGEANARKDGLLLLVSQMQPE